MKKYCVYFHENKKNRKKYVGMTSNPKRRFRCNGIEYKSKKSLFWKAIEKDGWSNFKTILIKTGLNFDDACNLEKEMIKSYKTRCSNFGYNITEGGKGGGILYKEHPKGMLGKKQKTQFKEEARKRMETLNKEGKMTWKNGHPKGMLGKTHSKEYIERLKSTPSGKHPSAIKVEVVFPNGNIKEYECIKYAEKDLGISARTITKIIKSKVAYKIHPKDNFNKKNKHLEGIKIKKIPR